MSETLPVDDVQAWLDDSDISCGDCGSDTLTVVDVLYDVMYEGAFENISPQRARIKCEDCGLETENSLEQSVVDDLSN